MAIENNELATIKKPNQVEYITKEEYETRVKEIAKCKRDIIYFAETYYRVVHPSKGLHIIKLYDVQKEFLKFLKDNNKVICCSGRQQGKSTIYCIYTLWLTCFHPDKRVMMLAQAENTALELLDRIKTGYEYLPSWLKPCCEEWNKKSVRFSNRSTISGFASSSNGPRGQSMNVLILDEFAFLPHNVEDKLFASVYPVISQDKNGKIFLISTPNGTDNLFYKIWRQATDKDQTKNYDGWKSFQMFYWQVPGHDTPEWKAAQIAAIGEQRFQQEFNCKFISSSLIKTLVPDDIIEKYRIKLSDNKKKNINQGKDLFITSTDGKKNYVFRMYHDFDPNRTYLASSDIAEGIKKDSSVLYVWDVTDTSNIKMCLKFSSNEVSILEFAYITKEILKLYNNPFLACESNGISLGYIEQLRVTYGYENMVRMNKENGFGIDSHVQVKTRAALWFKDMMTTMGFGFEIYDSELIDEFSTFVKKDTKVHEVYAALGDNHDDHIMAMLWACWILNPDNIEKYFVVADVFTSSLGQVYPRNVQPLNEYLPSELEEIRNNSIVQAFQIYKENNLVELKKYENEGILKANEQARMLNQNVMIKPVEQNMDQNRQVISMEQIQEQYRRRAEIEKMSSQSKLVGGGSNFFGSIGGDKFFNEQNQNTNVVWDTNQIRGGIDNLFGLDDSDTWGNSFW